MSKDNRHVNEEYSIIGQNLIETEPILDYLKGSNVKIIYLESEKEKKEKGKVVFGQCEKVQDKNKWAIAADYTITLFKPNIENENVTDKGIELVILHELYHINDDLSSVRPHDLEDFKFLIDEYGTDWIHA